MSVADEEDLGLPRELAEASCLKCGYRLRGLASRNCPECGTGFDPANPWTIRLPNRPNRVARWVMRSPSKLGRAFPIVGDCLGRAHSRLGRRGAAMGRDGAGRLRAGDGAVVVDAQMGATPRIPDRSCPADFRSLAPTIDRRDARGRAAGDASADDVRVLLDEPAFADAHRQDDRRAALLALAALRRIVERLLFDRRHAAMPARREADGDTGLG